MKNKIITMFELIGLIKDGKPPKKIKYNEIIYQWIAKYNGYLDNNNKWDLFYKNRNIADIINTKVEILPEENDEQHIEMQFPDTFEEFIKSYSFTDDKEIYTNGSELIPTFRLKQWIDHKKTKENDGWVDIEELEQIISSKAIYDNREDITKDIHNIVETIDNLVISFNQLIKNLKYLKERLDKDE